MTTARFTEQSSLVTGYRTPSVQPWEPSGPLKPAPFIIRGGPAPAAGVTGMQDQAGDAITDELGDELS